MAQFRLQAATRLHEGGIASNRRSAYCGESVPGPCYDFTPVMSPAVVIAPLAVRLTTSGKTHSHGVTGGVYKTRERIHRDILSHDY